MEQSSNNVNINTEQNLFNYADVTPLQTLVDGKSFERTFIKSHISTKTKMDLSQHNQANNSFQSDINDGVRKFLDTPPMTIKSALMPKAPIKKKKHSNNCELKPKKLTYKDEEYYKTNDGDSGVVVDSEYSLSYNRNSEKCNVTKCNIFNCDRSIKHMPNIKEVMQNSNAISNPRIIRSSIKQLQLNDKINENNIPRNTKSTLKKTTCNKKSTNYSKNNLNSCERKESEINSLHKKDNESNHSMLVLSQYNGNGMWQDRLQWLQPRRDIGMWIECCQNNCKKWRYTEDYHDPLDVPFNWYCEMNSDTKIASCAIPEIPKPQEIEADLIENKYNAGSIVWAKKDTYFWWPAMVDDCPSTCKYYELKHGSIIPIMYHVIFFDEEELIHSWHKCEDIEPFIINQKNVFLEQANYNTVYANKLRRSYHLACTAISMTILERLKTYSFLTRYQSLVQLKNNEDNDISCTINSNSIIEGTAGKILYNNNKRLSTTLLENLINFNEIIPSSQPELDTTIQLKKKKK